MIACQKEIKYKLQCSSFTQLSIKIYLSSKKHNEIQVNF